jgi:hypothetical protein
MPGLCALDNSPGIDSMYTIMPSRMMLACNIGLPVNALFRHALRSRDSVRRGSARNALGWRRYNFST